MNVCAGLSVYRNEWQCKCDFHSDHHVITEQSSRSSTWDCLCHFLLGQLREVLFGHTRALQFSKLALFDGIQPLLLKGLGIPDLLPLLQEFLVIALTPFLIVGNLLADVLIVCKASLLVSQLALHFGVRRSFLNSEDPLEL